MAFESLRDMPMPDLAASAGDGWNKLWEGTGQGLQSLMDNITEGLGNVVGIAVTKGPVALAGMLGKGTLAAGAIAHSVSHPYDPHASEGQAAPDASHGLGQALDAALKERGAASLAVHVDNGSLGDLHPTAVFTGQMEERGRGAIHA